MEILVHQIRGCLYKLDFPNGKSYIGITKNTARQRFLKHCNGVGKRSYALTNAIAKYGAESVKINTLVIAEYSYLHDLEKMAIRSFGTKSPNGYNLTDGGEGVCGLIASLETRRKLREANLGKSVSLEVRAKIAAGLKGRPVKAETKRKISQSLAGHKVLPETREKLRLASTGKKQSLESIRKMTSTRIGVPRSEETKAKIGAKNRGKVMTLDQRKKISDAAKAQWARIKGMQNAQ